jgi:hypothetical protein
MGDMRLVHTKNSELAVISSNKNIKITAGGDRETLIKGDDDEIVRGKKTTTSVGDYKIAAAQNVKIESVTNNMELTTSNGSIELSTSAGKKSVIKLDAASIQQTHDGNSITIGSDRITLAPSGRTDAPGLGLNTEMSLRVTQVRIDSAEIIIKTELGTVIYITKDKIEIGAIGEVQIKAPQVKIN